MISFGLISLQHLLLLVFYCCYFDVFNIFNVYSFIYFYYYCFFGIFFYTFFSSPMHSGCVVSIHTRWSVPTATFGVAIGWNLNIFPCCCCCCWLTFYVTYVYMNISFFLLYAKGLKCHVIKTWWNNFNKILDSSGGPAVGMTFGYSSICCCYYCYYCLPLFVVHLSGSN